MVRKVLLLQDNRIPILFYGFLTFPHFSLQAFNFPVENQQNLLLKQKNWKQT